MALPAGVVVRVEKADALSRRTSVLALKYAQASYGVDAAALGLLPPGIPAGLPPPGGHLVLRGRAELAADHVMFLGVPALGDFTYGDIRSFASRALLIAAGERLHAAEICLTLHGVGFGLDEAEAFRSEVAGVLDAIESGDVEDELTAVTFLESDDRRVAMMTELLDELWPGGSDRHSVDRDSRRVAGSALASAGLDSGRRDHAFIAMPFDEPGDVVLMMRRQIAAARVVIADLSSSNPNVYLEVGFAWAARIPTILLCDRTTEPLFDVRGHRHLRFDSIRDLERKLERELAGLPEPSRAR